MEHCDEAILGEFVSEDDLLLRICHNRFRGSPDELRYTLLHELVHAYDFCRAKGMSQLNCKHLACTEVRPPLGMALSNMAGNKFGERVLRST